MKTYNVIISGVQGYVGQALLALVEAHPYLHRAGIHLREDKASLPFQPSPVVTLGEIIEKASEIDFIFLATPPAVSMEIVAALQGSSITIIDLSGAFRLSQPLFESWYEMPHCAPQFISQACYGLTPWMTQQSNYQLIANPGCYAACSLLSLLPLFKAKLIKPQVIIDAKSGVSGSGKQLNANLMFCEIANNFYPYKIGKHQHTPEIETVIQTLSGVNASLRLTTSLLPVVRGISMTLYAEAAESFDSDEALSSAIHQAMQSAYADYPLIKVQEVGKGSSQQDNFITSLKNVVQTPFCHIAYLVKNGQITLFSCIDNILKGAASQAIENVNAFCHLPLHTGLLSGLEAL